MQKYHIKWRKSKHLLDAYIEQYNAGRPLREQLRQSHKALAEYLLFLHSAQLARHQGYVDQLDPEDPERNELPRFLTNNAQLARQLGCSTRTVVNLRARLRDAGVILKEEFRGSNTSYELQLNPRLLHLQWGAYPENVIDQFLPEFQALRARAAGGGMKSLHHTVSSTETGTKELNELSGADFAHGAEPERVSSDKVLGTCGKPVENPSASVQNAAPESVPGTGGHNGAGYNPTACGEAGTAPPVAAAPPATNEFVLPESAPDHVLDAVAHLPHELSVRLRRQVAIIWSLAMKLLYQDQWLAEPEVARAEARLAEYFCYSDPAGWAAGTEEVMRRIVLVRRWIERAPKGQRRWVPLPSLYFDVRNEKGFVRTKKWYKKDLQARREFKARELLTKALREYQASFLPGAKAGPMETYRRISQRLGKRDAALLQQFHELILDSQPEKHSHAKSTAGA